MKRIVWSYIVSVIILFGSNYEDGIKAFKNGEYKEAAALYAADQGSAKSLLELGNMYANGQGVKEDYPKAMTLWKKASDKGFALADYTLGLVYFFGYNGVKIDYVKAEAYLQIAADKGLPDVQYFLGTKYYNGEGVPRNRKKAAILFDKASKQGIAAAQYSLGTMYQTGNGVKRDYKKAVALYKQSSAKNDVRAQYALSVMYKEGKGVPRDEKKAMALYQQALGQGFSDAELKEGSGRIRY